MNCLRMAHRSQKEIFGGVWQPREVLRSLLRANKRQKSASQVDVLNRL